MADAVAALLGELGATPPPREALEAEARAHVADPRLGIVLVARAEAPPPVRSHLFTHVVDDCEPAAAGGGGQEGPAPVGVLAASWARAIQVAGRQLTIEVLWTRREARGRGVGAALVDALAGAAAAAGAERVEVGLPRESFPALRATERFYLANGFELLGPRMRRAI